MSCTAVEQREVWLDGTPPGKIAYFAGEAKVTDVADLRRSARTSASHSLPVCCTPSAPPPVTPTLTLDDAPAAEPTAVIAERAGHLVLKTLEQAGGLDALAAAHEAVSAQHGNNYLPLLDHHYRSHRPALFTLLDAIELEPTSAERSVADAVEFLCAHRNTRSAHIPDTVTVDRPGPDGQLRGCCSGLDQVELGPCCQAVAGASSASSAVTRRSISSRIGRRCSTSLPPGSSRSQLR